MSLKLLGYRLSTTPLGEMMLRALSFGVSIPFFKPFPRKSLSKPFVVSITIDTESGYVAGNERRVWQKEAPSAFQGYYAGIRNLREMMKRYEVKATFFLSTHCFSAEGEDYERIIAELRALLSDGHEIGLHLHPDSDKALQAELGGEFPATSCFSYDEKQLVAFIAASRKIIGEHLGTLSKDTEKTIGKKGEKIKSIRWGNWALNTDGARAIIKSNLLVDSSATPGIRGHLDDSRKYDWSDVKTHYPYPLSKENYQLTTEPNGKKPTDKNSKEKNTMKTNSKKHTLEIPIATFSFFGSIMRADPQYSHLLHKAFEEYYLAMERPFPFVAITHSCEATSEDGKPTQMVKDLEKFIIHTKRFSDVEFATIGNAGLQYGKRNNRDGTSRKTNH